MPFTLGLLVPPILAQASRVRPELSRPSLWQWLAQPSGSVFVVLLLAFVVGGGIQGLRMMRARRTVDQISGDSPEIEAIQEAAQCGRAGLIDLFRLLEHPTNPEIRKAAGRSLAQLWKADELVAEEELAILVRGRTVVWKARRKYPRSLTTPISVTVEFGVPFLEETADSIRSQDLQWSYRIAGTGQVTSEQFSPWRSSPTHATVEIDPRHYLSSGPHRLILFVKVRTQGLTADWEKEFPQVPFSFEFDSNLQIESLLATSDSAREQLFKERLTVSTEPSEAGSPKFQPVTSAYALGSPLRIECAGQLPCDLAHEIKLEVEGLNSLIPAGTLVVASSGSPFASRALEIRPEESSSLETSSLDSRARVRAVLTPDLGLAWSDPEIRSVWPDKVVTEWLDVSLFRR